MATPERPSGPNLHEQVLNNMKNAEFICDVPGVNYLKPNTVEYHYTGDTGNILLIRVVDGMHVRVSPLSGDWDELPEPGVNPGGDPFRLIAYTLDPRLSLANLKDVDVKTGKKTTISGVLSEEKIWLGKLSVEENEAVRRIMSYVIDDQNRVESMSLEIEEDGEDFGTETMNFFYH